MPHLLAIAREEMPLARITLYTNGDYLNLDLFYELSRSVDAFVITQHGESMPGGVKAIFDHYDGHPPKTRYRPHR
jgi:hypothetical protein